jgi:O-antigen ligase
MQHRELTAVASPALPQPGWAPTIALVIIAASTVVFGCQPPWASGFLLAVMLALGAIHLLVRAARRQAWGFGHSAVALLSGIFVAWLTCTVMHDGLVGPQGARAPALSVRQLAFAAAFLAAGLLGAAWSGSVAGLRVLCRSLAWVGVALAIAALAQAYGHDIKTLAGFAGGRDRPGGFYTNANRFAVVLACCLMSGAGVLVDGLLQSSPSARTSRREFVCLTGAVVVMSIALGLTLSRLTLLAMAVVLALVALAWLHLQRQDGLSLTTSLSLAEQVRRVTLMALPVVVVGGWAAWCMTIGANPMRSRIAEFGGDVTLSGRLSAIQAAWPLLSAQPWWGHGLGTFESVFTTVQPVALPGRWRELHSDWLQLAIEAGIPALVMLVLLLGFWLRHCWQAIAADFRARGAFIRIFPVAGVLVAAICSLGDFPLREPATAMLVFFLAGALCRMPSEASGGTTAATPSPLAPAWSAALALIVVGFFGWGAWQSARSGAAYAASPWMGSILCPAASAQQHDGWQRAARIAPDDPELHYRLAYATFAAARGDRDKLSAARAEARLAAELQPLDRRFPWLEAAIAEQQGEVKAALRLRDLAAVRAPQNTTLREQNGRFRLRHLLPDAIPGEPQRDDLVAQVLDDFRVVLAYSPGRDVELARAMEDAGCLNSEIAGLWPGDDDDARLRRARFYCDKGQWDWAERELPAQEPQAGKDARWFHAVRGAMQMRRGEPAAGRESWKRAVAFSHVGYDSLFEPWLVSQAHGLPLDDSELLAEALAPELGRFTALAQALARALVDGRRWAAANRLLQQVAETSPALSALWAELALETGDYTMALQRARSAWELDLSSSRWGTWYDQFQRRLQERQAKSRL